jgi:hypothetical protein
MRKISEGRLPHYALYTASTRYDRKIQPPAARSVTGSSLPYLIAGGIIMPAIK